MNPSKRPVIFRVGYKASLLFLTVSLYFSLFVCLQSTVKAVVYEAPFHCTLVEKESKGSRQCSWHQLSSHLPKWYCTRFYHYWKYHHPCSVVLQL